MTSQNTHDSDRGLLERLRADLTSAMKRRDRATVSVIRTLLGAIGNSEAVPMADGPYDPSVGLGHDVERRELDAPALVAILDDEIERHRAGAAAAERAGRTDRAEHLRAELDVLIGYRAEL